MPASKPKLQFVPDLGLLLTPADERSVAAVATLDPATTVLFPVCVE